MGCLVPVWQRCADAVIEEGSAWPSPIVDVVNVRIAGAIIRPRSNWLILSRASELGSCLLAPRLVKLHNCLIYPFAAFSVAESECLFHSLFVYVVWFEVAGG